MKFTRVKEHNREWWIELINKLWAKGFKFDHFKYPYEIRRIRIDPEVKGYNVTMFSGRRTRSLTWNQYCQVNEIVNEILSKHGVSAKVTALNYKIVIRDGMEEYTEWDWETMIGNDNVGSLLYPIYRRDSIQTEKEVIEEYGSVKNLKAHIKKAHGW